MDSRILVSVMMLFVISTGSVFAQQSSTAAGSPMNEPKVTVQTDNEHYEKGDTIIISGTVKPIIGKTPITLKLLFEKSLVEVAQIVIARDGSYSHAIIAGDSQFQKQGEYLVLATYGEVDIAEVTFNYASKSEIVVTPKNFEVYAGNHGTFDVEYTIQGGTVNNMIVDSEILALIVQIESTDAGTITVDLPKEFIGIEKQDGKEDKFIILVDEIPVEFEEEMLADSTVVTIDFEQGDSDITIIGTYVVPEFGTIVMMVLIVGIMAAILITRNKFQMTL